MFLDPADRAVSPRGRCAFGVEGIDDVVHSQHERTIECLDRYKAVLRRERRDLGGEAGKLVINGALKATGPLVLDAGSLERGELERDRVGFGLSSPGCDGVALAGGLGSGL